MHHLQDTSTDISLNPFIHNIHLSISIGIMTVCFPDTTDNLIRCADTALYKAKARGRIDIPIHFSDLPNHEDFYQMTLDSLQSRVQVYMNRVNSLVSRIKEEIEELRDEADIDGLTRLFNRRYMNDRLPKVFQKAKQEKKIFTLALLDIDFFGDINKTYGWSTGDSVLKGIADCIRNIIRKSDWVARYGGDEISIVMDNTSVKEAEYVLQRIIQAVSSERFLSGNGEYFTVTVSIGAVERVHDEESLEALQERCSGKLLETKRNGRNHLCC